MLFDYKRDLKKKEFTRGLILFSLVNAVLFEELIDGQLPEAAVQAEQVVVIGWLAGSFAFVSFKLLLGLEPGEVLLEHLHPLICEKKREYVTCTWFFVSNCQILMVTWKKCWNKIVRKEIFCKKVHVSFSPKSCRCGDI